MYVFFFFFEKTKQKGSIEPLGVLGLNGVC